MAPLIFLSQTGLMAAQLAPSKGVGRGVRTSGPGGLGIAPCHHSLAPTHTTTERGQRGGAVPNTRPRQGITNWLPLPGFAGVPPVLTRLQGRCAGALSGSLPGHWGQQGPLPWWGGAPPFPTNWVGGSVLPVPSSGATAKEGRRSPGHHYEGEDGTPTLPHFFFI